MRINVRNRIVPTHRILLFTSTTLIRSMHTSTYLNARAYTSRLTKAPVNSNDTTTSTPTSSSSSSTRSTKQRKPKNSNTHIQNQTQQQISSPGDTILDVDETITDKDMEQMEQEILSIKDDTLTYTPYDSSSNLYPTPKETTTQTSSSTQSVYIDQQYLAPAPGFVWLTFPESSITLPLPNNSLSSSWDWHIWQGKGTLFGVHVQNIFIAPLPSNIHPQNIQLSTMGRIIDPSISSSSSSSVSLNNPTKENYEKLIEEAENTTNSTVVLPILPVRLSIRYYNGLLSSSLFKDTTIHGPLDIGKILIDLHIMRHMPPGIIKKNEEKVPPRIIHTWQSSGRNNNNGNTLDNRDILGVEYELVSLYGTSPDRHNVTLIIDFINDRIHEITLSSSAMEYDNLYEDNHESTSNTKSTMINKLPNTSTNMITNLSAIITQLRKQTFPSLEDLSLHNNKGLQFLLNNLTVSLPPPSPKKRRKEE